MTLVLNEIYLLTGGNQGDRRQELESACVHIEEQIGTIAEKSKIYETAAWGKTDQPSFLNQVLKVSSPLSSQEVLKKIHQIETYMGRVRKERWAERNIDIDILYYNDDIIVCDHLKVPHPELHNRRFTLYPLVELAPDFLHPVFNISNQKLLAQCPDQCEVKVYK
ncbi:2-amino-4-hydroxy-6-hydroxymethyldihydropteridine diphosphokinase [Cytophagaceae bacterium ABcell3]|nr:2-amino-4-hydroxy-6-hydroxymethyldihydropteridine diphosphokinase [Cytophagaceae bacterium ABcell3]